MRIGKMIITWALVLLMAVNSASACRWRGWSYCSPAPCYSPTYYSCYSYAPSSCPICAAGGAPVTTNRAPAPPAPQTEQPRLEPAPPAAQPPAAEPMPAEVPRAIPPTEAAPAPAEIPAEPLTPPAEVPMPEQPAPKPEIEDLFKEPTPGAAPAETPAAPTEPAKPSDVEDLFKEPAPGAAPGAAPAEMPKPGEPTTTPGDVDELFKEPAAAPAEKPAESAKPAEGVEDLFKDVDKKSTAVEKPTDAELEALFSPAGVAPAAPKETKTLAAEAEQLFGTPAGTGGSPDATAARQWTDNTGKFQVRARLVDVGPAHVRLLKETGKYTTVPFSRLSSDDRAFVRQHSDRAVAASF